MTIAVETLTALQKAAMRTGIGLAAIDNSEEFGYSDGKFSRLAANSLSLSARLSLTAPADSSILSGTGYSLTGSDASSAIDIAGTWNTSGTPTLIKGYVTDNASNAASLLLDLGVGGSSRFAVRKDGNITIGGSWNDFQFRVPAGGGSRVFTILDGATGCFATGSAGLVSVASMSIGSAIASPDVQLHRDAADTLALRRSTNAQTLNIYNTSSSNNTVYERLALRYSSANSRFEIATEHAGASDRNLWLVAPNITLNPTTQITVRVGGSNRYQILTSQFYPEATISLGTAAKPWGDFFFHPASSLTPSANGDVTFEFTNNTTLTVKGKGSDGTVRSVALTLAP